MNQRGLASHDAICMSLRNRHAFLLSSAAQNIADIKDGDSVVMLHRRVVAEGQSLPYEDQRLMMKAIVLGHEQSNAPRQVMEDQGRMQKVVYHRCVPSWDNGWEVGFHGNVGGGRRSRDNSNELWHNLQQLIHKRCALDREA